ncbi:SHOCT domain-containing protein [Knoellia locipacati]|uniref:SHOCT domain-containing protein n=1 Tax=Knoellia locipacati TaxID=882824 RepID=UPI00384BC4D9
MSEESAAAGWYPVDGGRLRYWDGSAWTEHFSDVPAEGTGAGAGGTGRLKGAASAAARNLTSNEMELPEGTLWSAIGKGVSGITTGRYRLDIHYLYFAKGALRTDAQQIPVSGIVDVDVRQTMTQKARNLYTVVVHVQRANGMREIAMMDDIPDGPAAQRILNKVSYDAKLLLEHRSIQMDGLRHQATNTTRQEVSYQGGVPLIHQPGMTTAPPMALSTGPEPAQIEPAEPILDGVVVDPIAQLKELGSLRDMGILTEEEFSAKKAEILRRL